MLQEDTYYQALVTRDARFDGKFFFGVKTTGIYCRPICPARPKRENLEFFASSLEAERSGYRPCMRCRPESAPLSAAWLGRTAVVERAMRTLHSRLHVELDEERFAEQFGVGARHLRRLFVEEMGKTPRQLALENRLNLARKLLVETALPITEVGAATGFSSIRRFNAAFKARFLAAPRDVRRGRASPVSAGLRVELSYRPPFDFEGLFGFYKRHAVGNLEWFEDGRVNRVVSINGEVGMITVENVASRNALHVLIDFPNLTHLLHIIARTRAMFDLDSDPLLVASAFSRVPALRQLIDAHPGVRLPSGWDGFEIGVATILGQLVSVEHGRRLVNELIELAGERTQYVARGQPVTLFPTPERLLGTDLSGLKTTAARRAAILEFARKVASGEIALGPTQDENGFIDQLLAIRGIGPWTARCMALRVLRSTDALPESDLIVARALKQCPFINTDVLRPWRGYAAALFWRSNAALN